MAKTIKIGGRLESVETGNIVAGANQIIDDAKNKRQSVINGEVDAELVRLDETKQGNLTFDNAPTEDSNNPVKSGGVYAADKLLSDAIEAILLLIPSAASALNKLVDMQTMNSSIATATATFRGTYNVVSDLELAYNATHEQIAVKLDEVITTADNNDYAFVQIPVSATSQDIAKTERYKFNGEAWAYEYDLNNSGFTQAQWDAINSTITAALVSKLSALPTATDLQTALNGKQDNLTFDLAPTSGSQNPVTSGGIYTRNAEIVALITALDTAKQDKLTFDSTPTQNSSNPVTSNGVYVAVSALQAAIVALDAAKQDVLTFDSTPTLGSNNPVKSSGIKTELNRIDGDIVTLNNLYQALTQSALVVVAPTDTWPVSNPNTTTIYRVVDRVNTPPQYYSDYMWNGTSMVQMAQYDNAIDDVPTLNSNNLVKSGGVKKELEEIKVKEIKNSPDSLKIFNQENTATSKGLLKKDGSIDSSKTDFWTTDFISLDGFSYLEYHNIFPYAGFWQGLCLYDSNKQFLDFHDFMPSTQVTTNNGTLDLSNYPTAAYIRFSDGGADVYCTVYLNTTNNFKILDYGQILGMSQDINKSINSELITSFVATPTNTNIFNSPLAGKGYAYVDFESESPIQIAIYDYTEGNYLIYTREWKHGEFVTLPSGHNIIISHMTLDGSTANVSCKILYGSALYDALNILQKNTITVGADGDFTRLRDGLSYAWYKGLQGESVTVYVMEGTYDLMEEFAEEIEAHSGTSMRGNRLGADMHVIFMSGSYVTSLYELSGDSEKDDWVATYFNPFYANGGNFIIEGLNIVSSNCRYCVHDERFASDETYLHIFRNCHMENQGSFIQCIGGGLGQMGFIEIDGGYFKSANNQGDTEVPAISYHSNNNCDSRIFVKNVYCADDNYIKFGAYGNSNKVSLVEVCGCSLGSQIRNEQEQEGGQATALFDVIEWNNIIRS